MNYKDALNFVKSLLNNFHLTFMTVKDPLALPHSPADLGLRKLLRVDFDYSVLSKNYANMCKENTIYRTKDFTLCYYLIFRLPPDAETLFATIGPYTSTVITKETLMETYGGYSFPPDVIAQLEKYYQEVPYVADESYLQTLLYTLGEWMWGSLDNFTIQEIPDITADFFCPASITWDNPPHRPIFNDESAGKTLCGRKRTVKSGRLGAGTQSGTYCQFLFPPADGTAHARPLAQ